MPLGVAIGGNKVTIEIGTTVTIKPLYTSELICVANGNKIEKKFFMQIFRVTFPFHSISPGWRY